MIDAFRSAAAILACALLIAAPALAQKSAYPSKPVRLIVQFPPGGGSDVVARPIATTMTQVLGQQILVENIAGAGGTIANETMVRAAPDGYTLILVTTNYAISPNFYKTSYDPVNGVVPIALVAQGAFILVVHPVLPATSVKELIALARRKPGALNFASTGVGATAHLGMELFKASAGVSITHVPYKGTSPALTDLLGGHVQMMLGSAPPSVPHIKTGKLRGLGVTTKKRLAVMPDLPSISETVPGYEVVLWYGVLGPSGLPKDIVARWNSELNRIIQTQQVTERFAQEGIDSTPGTPEVFAQFLKQDVEKWGKLVKALGIKGE